MTHWNNIILTCNLSSNRISWQKEKFFQWQKYSVQRVKLPTFHCYITCTAQTACTAATSTFTTVYIHNSHRGWLASSEPAQWEKNKENVHNLEHGMKKHRYSLLKMPSFYLYCSHDKNPECSLIKGKTLHRIIHMYSVKLCRKFAKISLMTEIFLFVRFKKITLWDQDS